MILSMSSQFIIFLLSVLMGFVTGFFYDFFRILRKIIKHNNFIIQIEDIIYWFLVTIAIFKFIIDRNDGETRFFLLAGVIIGMVLYFYTLSDFITTFVISTIHIIERIIKTIFNIILFPLKLIFTIIMIPIKFILKYLTKFVNFFKKLLKNFLKYGKIKSRKSLKNIKIIFKKI